MRKWHIVAYRQYGNWSVTTPFATLEKAKEHVRRHFSNNTIKDPAGNVLSKNTNSHVQDVTFLEIDLPE